MTDMHREEFERFAADVGLLVDRWPIPSNGRKDYFAATQYAWEGWCAALGYCDEQEKQA